MSFIKHLFTIPAYSFRNIFTIIFAVLTIFCSVFTNANGQAIPTAEHYSIYDYQAHPQNWSVVQDNIGRVYVANTKGVLEYDGSTWKLIELPNLASATALTKGHDGKIYVGATAEIGYLDSDSLGNKIYVSLSDKLNEKDKSFSTIWKVFATSEGVVFQSFEKIFWYKGDNFKVISPNSAFHLAFQLKGKDKKNQLFVREWGKGLHSLTQKGLEFVVGSELFADEKIYAILPKKTSTYFIVTEQKGIYTYNKDRGFISFSTPSDSLLKSSQVYCGIQLADGNYALGTRLAGILIFDSNFNFLYKISSKNGLKDDRVAYLYEDSNKQLWAALSNGISYIDVASSFHYFGKNTDINRNVLSISLPYKGSLYIGTVQGIFKSNSYKADSIKKFEILPYSERDTWKLGIYKDILLGAQNPGIAWIEKRGIEELLAASNPLIQDFVEVKNDSSHLIAASIEGLLLLKWQNNHWIFVDKIKGFSGASTKIIQDENNDFWVSDYNRGIFRLQLSSDFKTVTHSEFYGKLNGLPKNQGNHVFELNGKAIFGTLEGIYSFSENTFVLHPTFEKLIEKKAITIFEKDKKGNLWIVTQNEKNKFSSSQTLLVQLKKTDSTYQRYDAPFNKIKQIVQAVRPIDDNLVLIGTNEGLISYNPLNTIADKQPFSVFITQIEHNGSKDSLLFATDFILSQQEKGNNDVEGNDEKVKLPYELNSLRFSFGSSFFEQRSEVYYQTKLEPLDKNWSAWTTETQDKFTNLSDGDYIFHLKAKNLYGVESEEVIFKFTIKTPWFKHPLFYLFIVLLIGFFVQYGIRMYTNRLTSEKNILEKTVRERTEDMRQAYFNTRVLSKLGQEITSTRSIDEITDMTYQHVNKLMDASVFAIGIHNEEDETIEFPVAIENGAKLPFHFEKLDETGRFAVWCFINEQDLFINDSEVDYELYMSQRPKTTVGKAAPSLIYLPLKIKNKVIGVITVQSFEKNAYNDYHLNLLRSLAVYTAIAIENANSYHQINEQKDIIEDKNKQLISSINYAKRIQNAILPPLETIQEEFEDSFVLFMPRDIVSGDFYYFNKLNGKAVISAIDCTGHGVPGAFMSMIGYELLNEIILAKHIIKPSEILNALHDGISKGLRQEQTFTQDGMDMTLCVWDEKTNILEVAAARNQMYLFNAEDKERVLEIEADRQSIGGKMDENFEFKSQQIQIQKNDTIYLLTDGFQDQFGGTQDRKYLRRRLREFLKSHQHLSMTQQRRALQRELTEWKGNREQIDDILIIGIRF